MMKYTCSTEYFELVRRFPLTPLKTRDQHEQAMSMLQTLAKEEVMGQGASDYFDVLARLVRDYENEKVERVEVTPQQALAFIMEQKDLSQLDIAKLAKLQPSHVCEFLAGKRNLPNHAAATLGAAFKVDPMIFLSKVAPAKAVGKLKSAAPTKLAGRSKRKRVAAVKGRRNSLAI